MHSLIGYFLMRRGRKNFKSSLMRYEFPRALLQNSLSFPNMLALVSSPRDEISRFMTGVSDLIKKRVMCNNAS